MYCPIVLYLQALKSSYALVINTEPFETLTMLLGSKSPERYTLAAKFITTCNLEPKEVGMSEWWRVCVM